MTLDNHAQPARAPAEGAEQRIGHISTEDVRNCIEGTCHCWNRLLDENASLREQLAQMADAATLVNGKYAEEIDRLTEQLSQAQSRLVLLSFLLTGNDHKLIHCSAKEATEIIQQAQRELEEARALLQTVYEGYLAPPGSEFDWDDWAEETGALLARSTGTKEGQ